MAKVSPIEFLRQVKAEVTKVTWPTRKETITTTVLVFIMLFIFAVFFLVIDRVLAWIISIILGMGA